MARQLHLGTVELPPGITPSDFEAKKQSIIDFVKQVFQPTAAAAAPAAADARTATLSLSATVVDTEHTLFPAAPADPLPQGDQWPADLPARPRVELRRVAQHRYAVIAAEDIPKDQVVEVCPSLLVLARQTKGQLRDLVYAGDTPETRAVVLGYGMLYGAAKESNLRYYKDDEGRFVFVALRDIKRGEKLQYDYGAEWWESRDDGSGTSPMEGEPVSVFPSAESLQEPGGDEADRGTFHVAIRPSTLHGRGVFATKAFAEGEIVEVCPVLELHEDEVLGRLMDYVYFGDEPNKRAVVMGMGMMYNSSPAPNIWYRKDDEGNFVFIAARSIACGEELTHDYGSEWWGSRGKEQLALQPPEE